MTEMHPKWNENGAQIHTKSIKNGGGDALGDRGCPLDVQVGGGTSKSERPGYELEPFVRHLAVFDCHFWASGRLVGSRHLMFLFKISKNEKNVIPKRVPGKA